MHASSEDSRVLHFLALYDESEENGDYINEWLFEGQNGNTPCTAHEIYDGVEYSITYNPTYRTGISSADLSRLETLHKNIYDDFVTKTESRRVSVKQRIL